MGSLQITGLKLLDDEARRPRLSPRQFIRGSCVLRGPPLTDYDICRKNVIIRLGLCVLSSPGNPCPNIDIYPQSS